MAKGEKNMEHKYIGEMFKRADLQQFREFLMYGLELWKPPDKQTYGERLKTSCRKIDRRLKSISKDDEELDEIYGEFSDATMAYKEVFTEIGMKIGAKLLFQLLLENE